MINNAPDVDDDTAGPGIDARDRDIIGAMLGGNTVIETAKLLNISTATIYRRKRETRFRVAYADAVAGKWAPDAARLRSQVTASIDRLAALRDDPDSPPAVVVRAAVALVEMALKVDALIHDQHDRAVLMAQVDELRAARGI